MNKIGGVKSLIQQHWQASAILFILTVALMLEACAPAVESPAAVPPSRTPISEQELARLLPSLTPDTTFTPIPTVTSAPSLTPTTGPTQTPTVSPTPSLTPLPTVTATPPLPPFPEILPTPAVSRTIRVPILMYHYLSDPPEDADNYRINLSVTPDNFRAQLTYLRDNGFTVIDLYDVLDAVTTGSELPPKPIVITFDDGYVDNYEYAYPILEEFGFKGTFFVVTEFVDFGYEAYMSWEMIEEMAAAGHRIENHSRNHPDLAIHGRSELIWQILGPQETLAAHIGYKPMFIAYPGGSYDEEVLDMVRELNLWGAVTTKGGMWRGFHDRYEWTRTRVNFDTTIYDFERALPPPIPTPESQGEVSTDDADS